ncbi:hypothetical protein [Amycolatopsis sp. NPDC098790]|uniref:hypothetical protein n=1 Tax=Amycolatopsis sp. NPDC098790 TaxID=3363939 RepID=UPI003826E94C
MDAGDSAAWTAAIVAIVAAVISLITMGIAVWQAVLARQQAGSAWEQSLSARRSADVAEEALAVSKQAAAAAERQAAEALRQNQITEQQLKLARDELEAEQLRRQQAQADKYVAMVHNALLAAEALRDEIADNVIEVAERQDRDISPYAIDLPPLVHSHAERQWDEAVNAIRVDKPPEREVLAAIDVFNSFAKGVVEATDAARDKAEDRQLDRTQMAALLDQLNRRDTEFTALKEACDRFFAHHGADPADLNTP